MRDTGPQAVDTTALLERAAFHLSTIPRPFLRWAGSKRANVRHIVPALPQGFNTYFEPFLGSGALFFLLQPRRAVLGDRCVELIDAFRAVRQNVNGVVRYLSRLKPNKDVFYEVRGNRSRGRLKRAAEFIFLNKTCWNGLYRVNADGDFNVPFGRPKTKIITDLVNLRSCSASLQQAKIRANDFEESVESARRGDLVYLDPPYVTSHSNNGFIDYNEVLFSWADQERLAMVSHRLAKRGVHVVISNADHRAIRRLYRIGFSVRSFERSSTLAANPEKRGRVREIIVVSAS